MTTDQFDQTTLGRTIKLVERFETMPDSTWILCKAILCSDPGLNDAMNPVHHVMWDSGYIAHVMDRIAADEAYGITSYLDNNVK
ncbi:MAG: hypothetical protein QQN63_00655 [Nitrosopumilus sp.]